MQYHDFGGHQRRLTRSDIADAIGGIGIFVLFYLLAVAVLACFGR